MALTIYQVNQWHTPSVSHGYEPVAYFSDRPTAERFAEHCNSRSKAEGWEYCGTPMTFDVEEVTVDDPDFLARIA